MKKILALNVVLGLLIFAAVVRAKPAPPPMGHCPRVHEAIQALDVAMEEMQKAGHDYCGHKVEAMEATRHAREQLALAEKCKLCN